MTAQISQLKIWPCEELICDKEKKASTNKLKTNFTGLGFFCAIKIFTSYASFNISFLISHLAALWNYNIVQCYFAMLPTNGIPEE